MLSMLGKEMKKDYVTREFIKFLGSLDGVSEVEAFEIIQSISKKDIEAATNINMVFNMVSDIFGLK